MTTKPKTRKAPAAVAASRALKELDPPWRQIVDAQDVLADASNLADAINMMALNLNECEGGAFCAVANALKESLCQALDLIECYRKKVIAPGASVRG